MRVQGALHDLYVLEGDLEEEQYAVQPQDRVAQLSRDGEEYVVLAEMLDAVGEGYGGDPRVEAQLLH